MFKKYGILVAVLAVVVFLGTGLAQATPKWVDAKVACDVAGNVTLSLPAGATLKNVEVYDDLRGVKTKNLGPVLSFKLENGQGFNFTYSDGAGTWYQMITPRSVAAGLATDCGDRNGCKFIYIAPKQ